MNAAPIATERRMSRVDTAWLRMDNPVNLMMIVGVWLLTPAITLPTLRQRIADKLMQYPRFGQCAVVNALGAAWVDDTDFDLDCHVVAEPLAIDTGQSERAALQQLCGVLAATPLDPGRPLWQFHLVEHYQGGCALIARIHHCIGDGIALISVMNTLTDGGQSPPPQPSARGAPSDAPSDAQPDAQPDAPSAAQNTPASDWLAQAVLKPLTGLAVKALEASGKGLASALGSLEGLLIRPRPAPQGGLDMALTGLKVAGDVASDLAALALMADDSPTRLKGKPNGQKVVAWGEPLPLDAVKAVGQALGCSINDVLLSCVSGAIGSYLRDLGDTTAGLEIRAMVPVNLRPLEKAWQLGNRFGLAPLLLPIGMANPVGRVYAVRARMAQLKGSFQPLLAFGVLAVTGLMAKPVQDVVLGLFSKKTTAVMTNVPGPKDPLKFCGATLRQTMFWVPASGDVGMGVSILSYGGGVQFGLITDAALCPDPQAIIDRFEPEFEQLLWLSLMLPWGQGKGQHGR